MGMGIGVERVNRRRRLWALLARTGRERHG